MPCPPIHGMGGESCCRYEIRSDEGSSFRQADVREVQGNPPKRGGSGHLPESAPQAEAGLDAGLPDQAHLEGRHLVARIAGINIPVNKRVEIGLTYIFGIGQSTAKRILSETGVDPNTSVKDLTEDEVIKLREAVENREVEGDLRRERSQNVKRLMEIGAYRGLRHRRGLPVRGQRTKTNARGRKGPRRLSVAGKRKTR